MSGPNLAETKQCRAAPLEAISQTKPNDTGIEDVFNLLIAWGVKWLKHGYLGGTPNLPTLELFWPLLGKKQNSKN